MGINVRIRVTGSLKEIMGNPFQISLPDDSTIQDLLDSLSNEFDQQLKEKFNQSLSELSPALFILLNDADISLFEDEHTKLSNNDHVTILMLIHGGNHEL
ncbi:MAG: MoaD/ThiS family protein [Candidatus Sifarchaeia archaeon]|jgi:molybdopterin converting factor small subunit